MAMTDYRVGCLGRNPEAEDFGEPDKNRCMLNGLVTFLNDYVFGTVFMLELLLKVLAFGFAWEGDNTYMSDKWNVLDFICVMAWIVGQLEISGMPRVTYFRSFRLLRPLKSLSKFPGLRAIISTFLAAIPRLKDVVILLLFLLLVCSIACMQFFKGYLHYRCRITRYPTRIPDTWYKPCLFANYPEGNCIKGTYFPTQAEFDFYRNVTLTWDTSTDAEWDAYSASALYLQLTNDFNWTRPQSWACTSPKYNTATGYPHGIPVTAEYPGRKWGNDGKFVGKEEKGKLWAKPKRCVWLVDEDDARACSLPGNGGLHTCWKNTRQQRGMYLHSSSYADKANPVQSIDKRYGETTCGSNYDEYGYRRFRYTPTLHTPLRLRNTIPDEFEDWSRWSEGYFRTMYPEFIPELNFGYTNFDNIGYAMVALFQAVTMEGWTDIMYMCMDVFSPVAAVSLFLGLFAIGSMLVLNLVLGVIADALSDEQDDREDEANREREADKENSEADMTMSLRHMSLRRESRSCSHRRRDFLRLRGSPFRVMLLDIVQSSTFSYVIYFCIGLNTLALCLDDYPRPSRWSLAMEVINVGLTFIFILEMFIKVGALGISEYMKDQFNIFDGCIVIVSIVDLLLAAGNVSFGGGAVFSALRCFRVFRIFKLAKSWTSLQVLLTTIYETTREIGNFLVLLLLFAFIFALAGQQLFANQFRFDEDTGGKITFSSEFPGNPFHEGRRKKYNLYIKQGRGRKRVSAAFKGSDPEVSNFDDFGLAFITVFGILTGESWNLVMYDMIRGTNFSIGVIYMGLTIIILSFCLMNMFLAILLSKFEGNEQLSHSPGHASSDLSSGLIQSPSRFSRFKSVANAVLVLKKNKAVAPAQVKRVEPSKDDAQPRKPLSARPLLIAASESEAEQQSALQRTGITGSDSTHIDDAWYQTEDKALGLFEPDHPVRKFCRRCIDDGRFDKFIVRDPRLFVNSKFECAHKMTSIAPNRSYAYARHRFCWRCGRRS